MGLLGYWFLGMIGVVVLVVSSVVTSIFWLSNQVAASFAGANSGSRTAFSDATARLHDAKHDFVRDVSIPLLAPWLAAILLAVLNYKMLIAPSTGFLLACMLICLFIAICIMASFIERPPSAAAGDPVIPPPTNPPATPAAQTIPAFHASTTLTGHSGVTYADPLATLQSVSIKSLPESLRPKPLIENFGTPIRGPLSKDFGARRTPEGLHTFQPSFFTTPPRPTFT